MNPVQKQLDCRGCRTSFYSSYFTPCDWHSTYTKWANRMKY